jgi:hypothetical protein
MMASTYSTNLGLELIATGEQSGTWGATTNANFGTLTEQAIVGYGTQVVTDSGSATVLTISNGAASTGRNYVVELTGTLTTDRTVTVPAVNKPYVFYNNTIGGFSVTVKVSGQTGVTIKNGRKAIVYTNTTDVIEIANSPVTQDGTLTLTNKTLTAPVVATIVNSGTLTLPTSTDTLVGRATTDTLTNKTLTTPVINGFSGSTAAITIGTTQLVKDTSGNVGIGTSSPATKLDVNGTLAVRGAFSITSGNYINFLNADNSNTFFTYNVGASGVTTAALAFVSAGVSEWMRITAAGNVGIGTSTPGQKLDVVGTTDTIINLRTSSGFAGTLQNAAASQPCYNFYYSGTAETARFAVSSDTTMSFSQGPSATERMRIDSSGSVFINTSSHPNATYSAFLTVNAGSTYSATYFSSVNPGSYSPLVFLGTAQALAGYVNVAGTVTTYNSISDYRLKDEVTPMTGGLAKINALRPVTYKWRIDGSDGEGFIAHELQSVVPFAVTGEKDAVNKDGSIKAQGVDAAKVVAHLVAAIQELSAKNDALEARLAKLETV